MNFCHIEAELFFSNYNIAKNDEEMEMDFSLDQL